MNRFRYLLATACIVGSVCLATVATAQQPGTPIKGNAVMATITVTATVVKIDQKTRVVTLKAADGETYSFVANEAVKNLAQVKKGDLITATYTEAVAYELKKGGSATGAVVNTAGGAANPGSKPAAAVGGTVTLTVVIAAIDPKTPSVTFKSASGETRTVKVQSPEKLAGVSVGDTVQITYAEAIAMKVEPASAKK